MTEEGQLDFSMLSDMDLVVMRHETKDCPDFRRAINLELSKRAKRTPEYEKISQKNSYSISETAHS
jgi:hypothetical protein